MDLYKMCCGWGYGEFALFGFCCLVSGTYPTMGGISDTEVHRHQNLDTSQSFFKDEDMQPTHHHISWICKSCLLVNSLCHHRCGTWNCIPRSTSVFQWHAWGKVFDIYKLWCGWVSQNLSNLVSAIFFLVPLPRSGLIWHRYAHTKT